MKDRNNHRVGLFIGLCVLLIIILASSSSKRIIALGDHYASDNELDSNLQTTDIQQNDGGIANCRYGVVAGHGQEAHVPRIGAGWFLDFNPPNRIKPVAGNNAEYVHVFMVFQRKTQDGQYLPYHRTIVPLNKDFAATILANPGDLWLIGNEVDRGPNPGLIWSGQGDMYPEIYAQAYHDVRAFIKGIDPTARTAISGLVQITPGRLQYLDMVWNAYQQRYGTPMPVDIWNMHLYVLPEVEPDGITPNGVAGVAVGTNPALGIRSSGGDSRVCDDPDVYCFAEHDDLAVFGEQVLAMRQWMKEHDQQQKPLILSEFSILFPYIIEGDSCFLQDEFGNCFTPDRVSDFMTSSFTYLNQLKDEDLGYALDEYRLVQQWNWFSIYTETIGTVSNILQSDRKTLTQIGKTYQQAVFAEPPVMNLLIDDIPKVVTAVDQSGKVTAPLKVTFRNNGNTAVDESFTVTFYKDYARTREIGSILISEMVRGCTTNSYNAVVEWPDLSSGKYPFWVTIDSENSIEEGTPQQQDNLGWGQVVVYPESLLLPFIAS